MIPKIIHFCWFGKSPIPETEKKCIESWKKILPEYQIMQWNEESFDINKATLYVQQAYQAKKYAFVSDYVRMYALNKYGGIYFDTDVEIIKPIDFYLNNQFFIGFENRTMPGTGIIGSVANTWILQEMLKYYDNTPFIDKNGLEDTTTNVKILVNILEKYNFNKNNKEQIVRGLHFYERDIFNPKKIGENNFAVTERTITIHHLSGSWLTEREKKRGTNIFWRNICRPILRNARSVLTQIIGKNKVKKIEVIIRNLIK